MNSEPMSRGRILTIVILLVGMAAIVRLGVIAFQSRRTGSRMTEQEFHETMKRGAEVERELWEKNWKAAGIPAPPGGFDAEWKRGRGEK